MSEYATFRKRISSAAERDRLSALGEVCDPFTRARLGALGVGPGWHCADVGAGTGAVTWMLADLGAEVLAVDVDTTFLAGLPGLPAGVTVVRADITDDAFRPPRPLDLVHARLVLMHLRQRDEVLARLRSWLAPGGWLVVTDAVDTRGPGGDTEWSAVWGAAWTVLGESVGTDLAWGHRTDKLLAELGLTDVASDTVLPGAVRDEPMVAVLQHTLAVCRDLIVEQGLAPAASVARVYDRIGAPGTRNSIGMLTAWGRAP